MPFSQKNNLRYYTFEQLENHGLIHAVFTRRGGVSPSPWASLNVGSTVGDDLERVEKNLQLLFHSIGLELSDKYDVWQVHGNEVICTGAPRQTGNAPLKGDGILTNQPGVVLFMRFADCVPVLLYDPIRKVVGIVHAGWMGTVRKIVLRALQEMQVHYSSQPADILACIGPSIGPDHYEIGENVIMQVTSAFGKQGESFLKTYNSGNGNKVHLDLWSANEFLLRETGVEKIESSRLCTVCHIEDWYSHRGENGKTGRFGALIALK